MIKCPKCGKTEEELVVEVSGGVCTDVYKIGKEGKHIPVEYTLKDFDNEGGD